MPDFSKLNQMKRIFALLAWMLLSGSASAQKDSLDIMIGQMIMIGLGDFSQLDTSAVVFDDVRSGKAGGIILFEKNLAEKETAERLNEILEYAQKTSEIPLFVSIDEEGGRVNRLKPKYGFPQTKTAQELGKIDQPDTTRFYAGQTASTLYKLGINMNFAPAVDVNVNPKNPVIGSIGRSYSADYLGVVKHADQFISSHELFGVATVLKHFPGHGSSKNDTHLGIADVSTTWQIQELYPYKALIDSGKVRAIMTAHIVNASLDDRKLPATLSDKIISGLLRGFLEYDGVVITDDMQMAAISKEYGLQESVKKSILAGVDILLFANNVPDYELVTAAQIHQIIKDLVKNKEISDGTIRESFKRILTLKANIGLYQN